MVIPVQFQCMRVKGNLPYGGYLSLCLVFVHGGFTLLIMIVLVMVDGLVEKNCWRDGLWVEDADE